MGLNTNVPLHNITFNNISFVINDKIVFELDNYDYEHVLGQIDLILIEMKIDIDNTYLEVFNQKIEPGQQEKLWILRTLLLYNILIIATLCMKDNKTFELVKKIQIPKLYQSSDLSMFPEISNKGLDTLFELGNFGSYNKTSDIDLGIQFIGDYKTNTIPEMVNIIWLIEGLFIVLTGYDTLQYDIELYGDMLTIKEGEKEIFYLDTSKIEDITPLLPCAMFSVARNQLIDTIFEKSESNIDINQIFETNAKDKIILNDLQSKSKTGPESLSDKEKKVLNFLNANRDVVKFIKELGIDKLTKSYNDAKTQMINYLKSSISIKGYIQTSASRKMYYDALLLAEEKRVLFLNKSSNEANDIIELIHAIANALSYRMEDYTCVSTVTHVVRTIQSGLDITSEPEKDHNIL